MCNIEVIYVLPHLDSAQTHLEAIDDGFHCNLAGKNIDDQRKIERVIKGWRGFAIDFRAFLLGFFASTFKLAIILCLCRSILFNNCFHEHIAS